MARTGYHLVVTAIRVSEYTLRRRVNFYEVDQAGIVHFSNFYRFMEEAEYGLWRSAGVSLEPDGQYAFPRVAASFDYHAPLRFADEFDVRLQIAAIGRTSLRYRCRITRGPAPIATGSMTLVCVTLPTMRPTPLPPDWLERVSVNPDAPDT
jgi:YbgC/YbaW family acyl-CoA thioester hydrolase